MDFIDDVEYFGLRLLLLFVLGCLLWFLLVFVYTLSFYMVALGSCIKRRNLLMDIMKNWLSRDRKISGLAIYE